MGGLASGRTVGGDRGEEFEPEEAVTKGNRHASGCQTSLKL